MSDIVIKTEKLTKIYKENSIEVKALSNVDLEIKKGEFSAIVGPSGSGKTTFLYVISGLDSITSGKVFLSGKDISLMNKKELSQFRRDHIGFIFQAYNLIPVLTVEENIEYIMLIQGVEKQERHRRVIEILKEVGLEGYEDRFPPKLSGGQQQRVAIARAMVSNPSIILADEPTANLDSKTGSELLDMMKRLNEEKGMTFLFSTHDKMIMDRAKRVITLRDGEIVDDNVK